MGEDRHVCRFEGWKVGSTPHPRVFLAKSVELLENKRVEFFGHAKEFVRV
jgi:hypothetical protein